MPRPVNCRKLRELLGLSHPTITVWQKKGYIKPVAPREGRDKFFDLDEVMLAVVEHELKITPAAMARVGEFQSAPQEAQQ